MEQLSSPMWHLWRGVMRKAVRHGKLTKPKVAKILAQHEPDFREWAIGDDEELREMVDRALRTEQGTLL